MNSEPPGAAPPSPPPTPIRGPVEAWAALGGRGPTDAERATVLKQMNGTQRSFGGTPAPSMFSAAAAARVLSLHAEAVGDIRSAFRYRDWLAHGRYWIAKLGRQYDFETIYDLGRTVELAFPFLRS